MTHYYSESHIQRLIQRAERLIQTTEDRVLKSRLLLAVWYAKKTRHPSTKRLHRLRDALKGMRNIIGRDD